MGALTFDKLLIIGVIAMLIFGPERLPGLAQQFAQLIKKARSWTDTAKERVSEELGEDFDIDDWRKLDPRQYDPRRIIREALLDDAPVTPATTGAAPAGAAAATAPKTTPLGPTRAPLESATFTAADPPPYDTEAT